MLLTLAERYALVPLLPQRGDYQTLVRSKGLQAVLVLGNEEASRRGLAFVGDQIIDTKNLGELNNSTEVQVSEKQAELIVQALKGVEAGGDLPMSLFDLYERLVREPDDAAVREAEAIVSQT